MFKNLINKIRNYKVDKLATPTEIVCYPIGSYSKVWLRRDSGYTDKITLVVSDVTYDHDEHWRELRGWYARNNQYQSFKMPSDSHNGKVLGYQRIFRHSVASLDITVGLCYYNKINDRITFVKEL